MPIQVLDYQGTKVFESGDELEVANYLSIKPTSLYTRLSAGKGSYTIGKGPRRLTVQNTNYTERPKAAGRRGPAKTEHRYLALYIDPETETYYRPPHETTLEEIAKNCKRKTETVVNRFNKGEKVIALLRDPRSYGFVPCTYKRVKPDMFVQLDSFLAEWVTEK